MVAAANLVEVAALVGDTGRATMLAALMGGQALTGNELGLLAGLGKSTTSEHLSKLVAAKLITATAQGRFKYYRISSPRVATMLESIIAVAAIDVPPRYQPRSAADEALCLARTCYDHLAGRLGVTLSDAMIAEGCLVLSDDGGELTPKGRELLSSFGANLTTRRASHRIYCKPCLDWSERRYHVAGHVGAEICRRCFELKWIERQPGTRAVKVTSTGRRGLRTTFNIDFAPKTTVTTAPRTQRWPSLA
jgi:DNA-binding transcriptional ArsR family regulator